MIYRHFDSKPSRPLDTSAPNHLGPSHFGPSHLGPSHLGPTDTSAPSHLGHCDISALIIFSSFYCVYTFCVIKDASSIRILEFHTVVFHNHLICTADLRTYQPIMIWVLKTSNKFSPFVRFCLFSSIPKLGWRRISLYA